MIRISTAAVWAVSANIAGAYTAVEIILIDKYRYRIRSLMPGERGLLVEPTVPFIHTAN
jgi:hypothetical protein